MSKSFKLLIVPILVIGFLGCSSVSISSDYDPGVDFSSYKTYKLGADNDPNDILLTSQLVLKRVYEAIDITMGSKGFTKVTSNPDFVVYPHAGTQGKTDETSWGYGYSGWWGAGPYMGGNIDVTQYTEGTLYIDMVDMKKNQLMWRGVSEGILGDPSTPFESTQKVDDAVSQVLKDFPPQPKSNN